LFFDVQVRQYLSILAGSLGAFDVNTTLKGVGQNMRLFSKFLNVKTLDDLGINGSQETIQLKKELTRLVKYESDIGYYSQYVSFGSFEFLPWNSSIDTKVKLFKRNKLID